MLTLLILLALYFFLFRKFHLQIVLFRVHLLLFSQILFFVTKKVCFMKKNNSQKQRHKSHGYQLCTFSFLGELWHFHEVENRFYVGTILFFYIYKICLFVFHVSIKQRQKKEQIWPILIDFRRLKIWKMWAKSQKPQEREPRVVALRLEGKWNKNNCLVSNF